MIDALTKAEIAYEAHIYSNGPTDFPPVTLPCRM